MFKNDTKDWFLDLTELQPMKNIAYNWSGIFTAPSAEWTHMTRELGEFELFIMLEGALHIADEHHKYTLSPNEYMIMRPTMKQYGFKPSFASFYWLHFTLDLIDELVHTEKPSTYLNDPLRAQNSNYDNSVQTTAIDHAVPSSAILINTGVITNMERLTILLNQLQETDQHYHHSLTTNSLTLGILLELYNQQFHFNKVKLSSKEQLYHDILEYINWNRFSMIRVSSIASYFGYHEKYISTFFKQMSGISLKQYLIREMMEHAKVELTTTDKPITQIAYSLGYSDNHNFTHAFKHVTGLSPLAYRTCFSKQL